MSQVLHLDTDAELAEGEQEEEGGVVGGRLPPGRSERVGRVQAGAPDQDWLDGETALQTTITIFHHRF